MTERRDAAEFIGFDLGHGETALGRAYGRSMREPEILEYRGERSFVTAVAKTTDGAKIGADAVNLAGLGNEKTQVWVKFKDRDLSQADVSEPTTLFTKTLVNALEKEGKIKGAKDSQFIIGCPSGWDENVRDSYKNIFEKTGLKSVRIVPESRAALMTALEQGYLTVDAARSSVLIVDIGSSTTDFTFCQDLDAEDVGHNFLGSGLLDTEILKINLERQPERKKIEALVERYPHYLPIMEYWCRQAKEQFFNGEGAPVDMIKRLPIDGGVLFDIRIDSEDARKILDKNLVALNGFTWPAAFTYALKETVVNLGGRDPETVLLTGGASRLPLILPACEKAFPNARIIRGSEPEFAIARGLAWLGRFEHLHASFRKEVKALMVPNGPVRIKAQSASEVLGESLAPALVDALTDACIVPAFRDWRTGKIENLDGIEAALGERVKAWLSSVDAQTALQPVIQSWFAGLQRKIERDTDPLCRNHGLPAMVLSLDDSQHVSRHLEGLTLSAPKVVSLESDTALLGTSLTAIIVGALLAHANLLAPLLAHPVGLVIGGAVGGAGFLFGRKALEGKFRSANVPVLARQVMTDGRIRKATEKQRQDLIRAVKDAWESAASERFTDELTNALSTALSERADDRAVLFMI